MDYWHKQTDQPLFADMLWSRPENRQFAGKLLVVGGNAHEFAAPAAAYNQAVRAGIGTAKVLLPNALQKVVGHILENGEFAPSTNSGSFNTKALAEWIAWSEWADGVLLAGDLGRNSETAIVLERFIETTNSQLTITKDAADYIYSLAKKIMSRDNTTLVISLAQLQKLCTHLAWSTPAKFSMSTMQLIELLHKLTKAYPCNILVQHNEILFVAAQGQVSTTKTATLAVWRVATAAHTAVWWLQNPAKPFEALTTGVYDLLYSAKSP